MSGLSKSLAITILTAAWGCAVCAADTLPAAASAVFDSLTYGDNGGFTGQGSGKSLTLTADGKLEARTRSGPARTLWLQERELTELNQAVAAVDWASVDEKVYLSRGAADLMKDNLSILIGGRTYATHADVLARIPAALGVLFKRLDALYRRATAPEMK